MDSKRSVSALIVIFLFLIFLSVIAGCGEKSPTIDSISPTSAMPGDEIKIKGTNFSESRMDGAVSFGDDVPAEILSWSDTAIACKVPGQLTSGTYKVSVQNGKGEQSNEVPIDVQEAPVEIIDNREEPGQKVEEDVEEDSGEEQETGREEEVESCKNAMISYAESHSEPGIEFTFVSFWMNDGLTEAEAILKGAWSSGRDESRELEQPGVTAMKQGERWLVTDFGTGIELEHL
ncbi:MAG: IPT/TIG domain-containing protein [Actinobacteria bacterium]|nr:IPT/TIG domain-containing protein [Actinomycetota bacterium]